MALSITIEGKGVIANCDALSDSAGGTWSEQGGGTMAVSTDVFLIGSACISGKYAGKSGLQQYDLGAGNELDFTAGTGTEADQLLYIWISNSALGTLDTLSTFPLTIRFSSDSPGTSNYIDYLIAGSDDKNGWDGGFKCFIIDPTKTPSRISGTQSSIIASVRTVSVWIDCSGSARADSLFIDQLSVGSGLRITGASTTAWKEVVDYCTDYTNRGWGMFQEREGIYFGYGQMNIGDAANQSAAVSFADTGRVIQFGISEYYQGSAWVSSLPAFFSGINIEDHTSYATTFTDGVLVGSDNGRSGSNIIGNSAIDVFADLFGGNHAASITTLYGTTLNALTGPLNSGNDSDHKFFGVSILKCAQFDPVGAPAMRNLAFAETVDTDGALFWNENINIQDSAFIANSLGAAIEMPSATGTPYSFTSLSFSGNTYDVLNSSGSAITINLSDSNAAESEGAAVTFANTVALTITAAASLVGAEVRIYDYNGSGGSLGDELAGVESHTSANYTYSGTGGNVIWVQIMLTGYEEFGQEIIIPSSAATFTALLIPELNN